MSRRDAQTDVYKSTLQSVVGRGYEKHEAGERGDEMRLALHSLLGHLKDLGFILRAVGSC